MRFLLLFLVFVASFNFAFAYSESTTHPALTDEIVDLFNLYSPELKISDEEKELVKKGSTDEDSNIRMMHHFYDPVYNRGLELTGSKWQSSKDWAEDTMGQASLLDQAFAGSLSNYFSSNADHSWNRAVYEYAWGDKSRAMYDLGHILHLIEDASVPDHTRNDPHPPWFSFGSPYEAWTAQFDAEKLDGLAKSLFDSGKKSAVFNTLQEYFNSMASYSNNNFFSEDTISNKIYNSPKVFFNDNFVFYDQSPIAYFKKEKKLDDPMAPIVEVYTIRDPDKMILNNYWSRLSKQAVLHGTGVVKLFFDEVEKEKQSKVLFNKNKSWFAKAYDAAKGRVFGISATLYGSSLGQKDVEELNSSSPLQGEGVGRGNDLPTPNEAPLLTGQAVQQQESASVVSPNDNLVPPVARLSEQGESDQPDWFPKGGSGFSSPGFGGGGSASDISPPYEGGAGGGQGGAGGGSEEGEVPSNDEDEVPSDDGGPADTTPPDISFSISECSSSISPDGCLVASSAISLSWSSVADDFQKFSVTCTVGGSACPNFSYASTTATTTPYILEIDEAVYVFSVMATDESGNESNTATAQVEYYSMPVVINEVAWAGTSASPADEWIELLNRTEKLISLSGWTLYAEDLVPYLNLSGNIPANGYYLIERTDDNTISDITADLVAPFSGPSAGGSGLSNSGEVLILSYASTSVDQTVLCDPGSKWCGGSNSGSDGRPSMERIDPNVLGTDTLNWGTIQYLATRNGKDANDLQLNATPKKRNSLNYLISQGTTLSSNKTLTKSKNPYIIPTSQDFVVNAGITLTIEPGVVIKMGDQSSITVFGDIVSSGTASDYITFTSIYDDTYEGDTNGDASASSPAAGSWKYLRIQSPSENSQISYTKFKYGGRYFSSMALDARAMVSIYEATTTISNSIFEESQIVGLRTTRFNGIISGSTFSTGDTANTDKVGLYIYEGSSTISGNTFSNNYAGLTLESTTATLDSLTFSNNYLGIQSLDSTLNVANPGSIIFNSNTSTTSPGGLF